MVPVTTKQLYYRTDIPSINHPDIPSRYTIHIPSIYPLIVVMYMDENSGHINHPYIPSISYIHVSSIYHPYIIQIYHPLTIHIPSIYHPYIIIYPLIVVMYMDENSGNINHPYIPSIYPWSINRPTLEL